METKTVKNGKWYMTIIGGLIGFVLGLSLAAASILILNQLYFVFLMFIPLLSCLFIKLLGGHKNIYSLLYSLLLSFIGIFISGFMLEADVLIQIYSLPKFEIVRLTFLMIASFGTYFPNVWQTIAVNIFNIIIILAYITIGLLVSWEFIFKPIKKKNEVTETSVSSEEATSEAEEFEYVYEDELEPGDEIIETEE